MTRDDIIRMAKEVGGCFENLPLCDAWLFYEDEHLERFAALVAAAERETCAKLCEEREKANLYGVKECAAAIRARGEV